MTACLEEKETFNSNTTEENSLPGGVPDSPPLEGWPKAGVVRNSKNYFKLPYNPELKQKARALRKAGILSEVLLWNQLKSKQFKRFDFDRQKIIGNYIVDFYCTNVNVVIEVDGSSHDYKYEYDTKREEFLHSLGIIVIHIPDWEILNNINGVMNMLNEHPAFIKPFLKRPPRPTATPPGEGNLQPP